MRTPQFRSLPSVSLLLVGALLAPSLAHAQSAQPAPREEVRTRTLELEHDGQALMAIASERAEGARLMETAGFERAATDPSSVPDLLIAGSAYYWSGHPDRARRVLTRLGERTESVGNPVTAANAYLMAAWIANDQQDHAGATYLLRHVQRLVASPAVSADDRREILGRIVDRNAVAIQKP